MNLLNITLDSFHSSKIVLFWNIFQCFNNRQLPFYSWELHKFIVLSRKRELLAATIAFFLNGAGFETMAILLMRKCAEMSTRCFLRIFFSDMLCSLYIYDRVVNILGSGFLKEIYLWGPAARLHGTTEPLYVDTIHHEKRLQLAIRNWNLARCEDGR